MSNDGTAGPNGTGHAHSGTDAYTLLKRIADIEQQLDIEVAGGLSLRQRIAELEASQTIPYETMLIDLRGQLVDLEAENKALREQVRWIPVSERLPKNGGAVLCRYDNVYENRVATFWMDGGGSIHFGSQFDADGKGSQPATHWMPLPPLPQETGE